LRVQLQSHWPAPLSAGQRLDVADRPERNTARWLLDLPLWDGRAATGRAPMPARRPHQAGPRAVITRDAAHRYTYDGITYPGVTTILGSLDKSGPLMGWAARETATAAVRMSQDGSLPSLIATTGPEGAVKALSARSNWTRDTAAQLGTEVHALADLVVHGKPLPTMTDTQRKRVEHYARWWEASGWTVRLSEAMVIHKGDNEQGGWGGTFDLLARDRDGRTILADIKTGKAVYKEAVLQLAAYGMASLVQPAFDHVVLLNKVPAEVTTGANNGGGVHPSVMNGPEPTPRVYPMPLPDRYAVLHVTAEGVREVEIAVGTAERMAFLACLDLYHWIESMKGKKF